MPLCNSAVVWPKEEVLVCRAGAIFPSSHSLPTSQDRLTQKDSTTENQKYGSKSSHSCVCPTAPGLQEVFGPRIRQPWRYRGQQLPIPPTAHISLLLPFVLQIRKEHIPHARQLRELRPNSEQGHPAA